MSIRRVVVTGMGLVTPLGVGVGTGWKRLVEGFSGVRRIVSVDVADMPVSIGGVVPRGNGVGELDAGMYLSAAEQRHFAEHILFAVAACQEALDQAGWHPESESDRERTGVAIGSGIGGLALLEHNTLRLAQGGPRRVSPFCIPGCLVNEAAGVVAIRHALRGPLHAAATACSSGAHAIGDAARMIQLGDADLMLAGGTEAAITRLGMASFAVMRALSRAFEASPEEASRPWDRARDGFVLGEGAGVLLLEEREHALERGANILAEIEGYGISGDGYHLTSPLPDGSGAARAMSAALRRARRVPECVGYLNAHATSTPVGDPIELEAVRRAFGNAAQELSISSTKSATGHLLGAAGGVEAVFSICALRSGIVPPTLNLHEPDDGCDLKLTPRAALDRKLDCVMSNSFAFGGSNACLVFGRGEK